jgi:hypothetical protein
MISSIGLSCRVIGHLNPEWPLQLRDGHLSEKLFGQLAEDIDPSGYLDEALPC